MLRNTGLRFICRFVTLRVQRADTPFTNRFREGQVIRLPIAHNEGRYTIGATELPKIAGQVAFRYCDEAGRISDAANPNGSVDAIAGVMNARGNVLGLMPHPERASEEALGSSDGRVLFESMIEACLPRRSVGRRQAYAHA
jgi:phosphoribosylformylglycinamidine synthase